MKINDFDVQVAFPKGTFSPVTFPPGTRLLHGTTSPGDHGLQVKPEGVLDNVTFYMPWSKQ